MSESTQAIVDYLRRYAEEAEVSLITVSPGVKLTPEAKEYLDTLPKDTPDGLMARYNYCRLEAELIYNRKLAPQVSGHRTGIEAGNKLLMRDPEPVDLDSGETVFVTTKSAATYLEIRERGAFLAWAEGELERIHQDFRLSDYAYLQRVKAARQEAFYDLICFMAPDDTEELLPAPYEQAESSVRRRAERATERDAVNLWAAHFEVGMGRFSALLAAQPPESGKDKKSGNDENTLSSLISRLCTLNKVDEEVMLKKRDLYRSLGRQVDGNTSEEVKRATRFEELGLEGF